LIGLRRGSELDAARQVAGRTEVRRRALVVHDVGQLRLGEALGQRAAADRVHHQDTVEAL
jgi:hypothetical protein